MKDLKEIQEELSQVKPGTVVLIRGYVNSKGDRRDMEVELAENDVYYENLRIDLGILEAADVGDLADDDGLGDLQLTDMITAREQLIASRQKSISDYETKSTKSFGPAYIDLGGSLARHPEDSESLYIRGVMLLSDVPEPKPAKGAVPRAKQELTERLQLPSRRYIHNLKLAPGKFDSVDIFVAAEN